MADFIDGLADLGIYFPGKRLVSRATLRCRCPQLACSGKRGEALAVTVDHDGRGAVFVCHRCGWSGSVRDHEVHDRQRPRPLPLPPPPADTAPNRQAFVRRLLGEARAAAGTVVERYLAGRGLDPGLTRALLCHRRLWHAESRQHWPAMLAPIRDAEGAVVGLHRTWLAPDGRGKAPVAPARKSLALWPGATKGGAIRLAPFTTELVIGEGIETTLAGMQMFGWPGWAAIAAGNLPHLRLPAGLRRLVLVADHDQNGVGLREAKAAASLHSRRGLVVDVVVPLHPGDANDVWRRAVQPTHCSDRSS
jgi:hypothetical protein